MSNEAEGLAASAYVGDDVSCIREEKFVGGIVRVWETHRSMPVLRVCTLSAGKGVLVLNRSMKEFEKGLAVLRPDVARTQGFRDFFEAAAPGLRRFSEADRLEVKALGSKNPRVENEEVTWIVDDFSTGLVEEFRLDLRTYGLRKRVLGQCERLPLL